MDIAVIGAGPAGLVSAKELAACGHRAVIFERSEDIGGLWNEAKGPTWKGMRTNLSKYSCAFSDQPHRPDTADFPEVATMHRYLIDYAEHFGAASEIRFGEGVDTIEPCEAGWQVSSNNINGESARQKFDGVIVGSGFFSHGAIPQLPGIDNFRGRVLHSADYRTHEAFSEMNVIVIGNGLSGVEICADLCHSAKSVTHIARRPSWIIPRYLTDPTTQKSIPLDLLLYRRKVVNSNAPQGPTDANIRRNQFLSGLSSQNESGVSELFIDPKSPQFFPVAISDNYLDLVTQRHIKVLAGIEITRIGVDNIVTQYGDWTPADAIIFATGYQFDIPFLSETVKAQLQYKPENQLQPTIMYKSLFVKEQPRLAFVGAYKGPFFGTIELQARLASQLFTRGASILDQKAYEQDLREELRVRQLPRAQFPHPDYVSFADSLACAIGCLPELAKNDPLYAEVNSGPVIPAHYRLSGPGKTPPLARRQIEAVRDILKAAALPERKGSMVSVMDFDIKHLKEILLGEWNIARNATGLPEFYGKARFYPYNGVATDTLLYHEDVKFPCPDAKFCDGFREYLYKFYDDKVEIYFTEKDPNSGQLFMTLPIKVDPEKGLTASDSHICGKDCYRGSFTFTSPTEFQISYQVTGPNKNYEISTVYTKV